MAPVSLALAFIAPEAPQVFPKHGAVHDSLNEARRQVEQGVTMLLAGQVTPVFESLFKEEVQVAPAEVSPEHHLGSILHVSNS